MRRYYVLAVPKQGGALDALIRDQASRVYREYLGFQVPLSNVSIEFDKWDEVTSEGQGFFYLFFWVDSTDPADQSATVAPALLSVIVNGFILLGLGVLAVIASVQIKEIAQEVKRSPLLGLAIVGIVVAVILGLVNRGR